MTPIPSFFVPLPISETGFNSNCVLPHNCTIDHIKRAMNDFIDFLTFINAQLYTKEMKRFETMIMPANFSSMVGEFMAAEIPKYCKTLVKNTYNNGHPDLIPKDRYPNNAILHGPEGIEIKASRHSSGWQGHNPEDVWLLVFVFDSNTQADEANNATKKPFRIVKVVGNEVKKGDWNFSGRSETSRRTITASITRSGYEKMERNWIYKEDNSN